MEKNQESTPKPRGRRRKYPIGSRELWIALSPELLRGLGGQCAPTATLRVAVLHALRAFCGLAVLLLSLAVSAVAGEEPAPELVTDAEIAALRATAEQARAGTLPGMMPAAEVARLRKALQANPRTQAEARLADYRRKALQDWEDLQHGGEAQANKLRNGGASQAELRQIRKNLTEFPAQTARSRLNLDIAEGRVTRQSAEAEIKAAEAELAGVEKARGEIEKNAGTALNPERYRAEQAAKLGAQDTAARAKLDAAQAKLTAVREVLGEDF